MTDSPTRALAAYVADSTPDAIPAGIRAEAARAILNYLGCALGGSVEPALDTAIEVLAPFSGPKHATVLGRREPFDELNAALLNGGIGRLPCDGWAIEPSSCGR